MQSIAARIAQTITLVVGAGLSTSCATMDVPASSPPASAWVAFDGERLTASDAAGTRHAGGPAVTIDDPVRIASITKLTVALGVMRLVEAGALDLDRDISDDLGWRVRHPDYPEAPITLRQLLSHTSSLTDNAGYALPLGSNIRDTLADPAAWDRQHPPGSYFRYANLNTPLIASVTEAATGERFDRLMTRIVYAPLGLDACLNWQGCSDDAIARAVTLYRDNGDIARDPPGEPATGCPVVTDAAGDCDLARWTVGTNGALFSPQGGLRISARDLARIGQMLLADGGDFLSARSIAEMTRPQWTYDGTNGDSAGETDIGFVCAYGLAVHITAGTHRDCRDDPFGDGRVRIGHAGDAYALKSGLWIDRAAGTGIAFFTTQVPDRNPGTSSSFTAAEEAMIARAMQD